MGKKKSNCWSSCVTRNVLRLDTLLSVSPTVTGLSPHLILLGPICATSSSLRCPRFLQLQQEKKTNRLKTLFSRLEFSPLSQSVLYRFLSKLFLSACIIPFCTQALSLFICYNYLSLCWPQMQSVCKMAKETEDAEQSLGAGSQLPAPSYRKGFQDQV